MQINPKVLMAIMVLFVELMVLAAFTGLGIVAMGSIHFLRLVLYVIIAMLIFNVTVFFANRAQKKHLEKNQPTKPITMPQCNWRMKKHANSL